MVDVFSQMALIARAQKEIIVAERLLSASLFLCDAVLATDAQENDKAACFSETKAMAKELRAELMAFQKSVGGYEA